MDHKVTVVTVEDEFRICPACGYEDGFHSMFKRDNGGVKWLFICPACHNIFDIGQRLKEPFGDP